MTFWLPFFLFAALVAAAAGLFHVPGILLAALLALALRYTWLHGPGSALGWLRFGADFLVDIVRSNLALAGDILSRRAHAAPTWVRVPVHDLTPVERAVLMHRISLTPGTLTADVCENGDLLVHVMYPVSEEQPKRLRRPIYLLRGESV